MAGVDAASVVGWIVFVGLAEAAICTDLAEYAIGMGVAGAAVCSYMAEHASGLGMAEFTICSGLAEYVAGLGMAGAAICTWVADQFARLGVAVFAEFSGATQLAGRGKRNGDAWQQCSGYGVLAGWINLGWRERAGTGAVAAGQQNL